MFRFPRPRSAVAVAMLAAISAAPAHAGDGSAIAPRLKALLNKAEPVPLVRTDPPVVIARHAREVRMDTALPALFLGGPARPGHRITPRPIHDR